MILILIGYRATGKTTLAELLARRLQWQWIDSDAEIERLAGRTIADIFARDGEAAFRDLESRIIIDLCGRDRLVLAAGGGAAMREENRLAMRRGKVVWLTARPETILKRMSGDASTPQRRPSLTGQDPLQEIVQLLALREPMYRQAADLIIDTENRSPEELTAVILDRLDLTNT
jgi:shikimate kinase